MSQRSAEQQAFFNTTKVPFRFGRFWQSCWRWCCQVALVQPSMLSYLEPLIRLIYPGFRAHLSQATVVELTQTGAFVQLLLKPGKRWQGFIPGQHVQLVLEIDGRAISRPFSISSALQLYQQQGLIQLTIQPQPQGQLTSHLRDYAAASSDNINARQASQASPVRGPAPVVHLSAAQGDFVLQDQKQPLLLLAAGSGITPIHAMLSSITRLTQPTLLIYSYRGAAQYLFAQSWQALAQRFPLLQLMLIDTERRPRLELAEMSGWFTKYPHSSIYLCGPQSFSQQWVSQLQQLNVPKAQIHQESFGVGSSALSTTTADLAKQNGSLIHIQQGTRQISIQSSRATLLQDLEGAGLQPTYGCRRGICMQCLCQKQQGLVRNLMTGDISDAGAGQIQLCISQPVSDIELTLGSP